MNPAAPPRSPAPNPAPPNPVLPYPALPNPALPNPGFLSNLLRYSAIFCSENQGETRWNQGDPVKTGEAR